MMSEHSKRLSRIVKDMFLLARADAGRYPLQKKALYLNDLVDEIARAGGMLASDKGVALELTHLEEAAFHGDEDLLREMVLNLVDNAVKFTPPGGFVKLALVQRANEYILSICDTGPGISPEARDHIFERFYSADKARARSHDGGGGLGLAIAKWIANAHNGDLELADSNREGTTFIARLPISAS